MVTVAVPFSFTTTFGGASVQVPSIQATPGGRSVGSTSLSVTFVPTGKDRAGSGFAAPSPVTVNDPDVSPLSESGWSEVQLTVNATSATASTASWSPSLVLTTWNEP